MTVLARARARLRELKARLLERFPWLLPVWIWIRRLVNVVVPVVLGILMLSAAVPRDRIPKHRQEQRDKLVDAMRSVSLSQNWRMYAPDPGRGHFYLEISAHDADGSVRELEETIAARNGWGTTWAWKRTRMDIWQHAVARRIDTVNRNRTWYLRGVCVREARRGFDVHHLEMRRVYRAIRSPEKVSEGAKPLGPGKRRKAQDASCNVKIIREMVEADPFGSKPVDG